MAIHGWGTNRPLKEFLLDEGYRFDFYQAVRLLEKFAGEKKISMAQGAEPEKEAIRFESRVSFNFPASEIYDIQKNEEFQDAQFEENGTAPSDPSFPVSMIVNFMGLAGGLGPLPKPYTELILERVRDGDHTLKDFLDIFNHRLISLMYRVRKIYRLGFDLKKPEQTPFARYFFALMGLETKGLRGRMDIKDRALLFYTELLAQQPRSMAGLEAILSDYFNVKVKGNQFSGQWCDIDEDQWTRIGSSGQNRKIGIETVIGTRVWDQQGKFELEIGPLSFEEFYDFLPKVGTAFQPLCELTKFYVGTDLEYDFILIVKQDEDIEPRLGRPKCPILGWTSWLKRFKEDTEYERVRLSGNLKKV